MQDENFSPQESLRLIESMINQAKNRFSEDGYLYLLWGWAVLLCSTTQFVLLHFFHSPYHYYVWMVTWVLLIYQVLYLRKKYKKERVRTYTSSIIGFVWLTFLIMLFLFSFLIGNIAGGDYYKHISPIMLATYGMPVFLSGIILRFTPLILGGVGCWILSTIAPVVDYDYQLLLVPAAMLIAWIIPGYLLRRKYKNQIT
jgi:FtsH-binding integral membrane protein